MADERNCSPIERAELERRWTKIREAMHAARIDALVLQGANGLSGGGGYTRWFTGSAASTSYAHTVIFPVDEPMVMIHHGELGGGFASDPASAATPGIGYRYTTAVFPSVSYTTGLEGDLAAKAIGRGRYRKLGIVNPGGMYAGFVARLTELVRDASFVDATDMVDASKAVKSEADIAALRRSAAMQDEVVADIRHHITPGKKDFEILAYGHYLGALRGSEHGYFLGGSARPGESNFPRTRQHQGRTIREGDVFLFQAENSGPDGLNVHISRTFVLGKAPQALVDAYGIAIEAQKFTMSLVTPGAKCSEIFAEYNAYLRARKLPEEKRLHCHGQGYETVERPLIRHDETMTIAAGMNIGCHPIIVTKDAWTIITDNFLIWPDGAERLHRTPQAIVEL